MINYFRTTLRGDSNPGRSGAGLGFDLGSWAARSWRHTLLPRVRLVTLRELLTLSGLCL